MLSPREQLRRRRKCRFTGLEGWLYSLAIEGLGGP